MKVYKLKKILFPRPCPLCGGTLDDNTDKWHHLRTDGNPDLEWDIGVMNGAKWK